MFGAARGLVRHSVVPLPPYCLTPCRWCLPLMWTASTMWCRSWCSGTSSVSEGRRAGDDPVFRSPMSFVPPLTPHACTLDGPVRPSPPPNRPAPQQCGRHAAAALPRLRTGEAAAGPGVAGRTSVKLSQPAALALPAAPANHPPTARQPPANHPPTAGHALGPPGARQGLAAADAGHR